MNKKVNKIILIVIIVLILLGIIVTLLNSFKSVPTGYVGVKTHFGKVQSTMLNEGLNIKIPYIEKIVLIDCRTQKIDVSSEGSTKDMQTVNISISVNYNVNRETANNLYKEVGTDYVNIIINPALLESIKSSIAQYTAEELITKRAEVSNNIEKAIIDKIANRGFNVTEFNITNIDFSEEYDRAIETKAVKQQEVATAQAELEKQKIQNEKEISEAEKDAKVMELQNNQITENTLKLKELEIKQKMIEKWNGTLPSTMLGEDSSALFNMGN